MRKKYLAEIRKAIKTILNEEFDKKLEDLELPINVMCGASGYPEGASLLDISKDGDHYIITLKKNRDNEVVKERLHTSLFDKLNISGNIEYVAKNGVLKEIMIPDLMLHLPSEIKFKPYDFPNAKKTSSIKYSASNNIEFPYGEQDIQF